MNRSARSVSADAGLLRCNARTNARNVSERVARQTILGRRTFTSASVAILVLTVAVAASPLLAGPLYSTSFNGTVDEMPTGWQALAGDEANPGWRIDPDGEFRFDQTGVNALSHYTGQFSNGQASNSFSDGTVESTFRRGGSYIGLATRIQDSSSFYHARLHGNNLEIYRFGGGGTASLGSVAATGYDAGESWTISMTLLGTTITASVFDQFGTPVATLSTTDASFSSGTVGVRGIATSIWESFDVHAPANLNVDIGLSGAGNRIQTDFQSFAGVNDLGSYSTSPESVSFTSDLGNANMVSATVASAQSNGQLGFRDRSNVTHELGALAEDFVFNLDGDRLNLTLGSLLPGHYRITTYHHDSDNYIHGQLDMSVSDALSGGRTVPGAVATKGASPTTIGSTTFSFFTDGVNPAVIHIDKGATIHASLNGFQLAPAAESLRVDFGATGQDVQNGFMAFTRGSSTTGLQTETYTSGLGTGGSVTVGLAGDNNSLSWRDRVSSTAPELPDVAEDFVFNLDYLELTLTDLVTDQYLLTTYHHDTQHSGSDLEIKVWDAAGDGRVVEEALWQTISTSADPALATFSIYAGDDPVTIRFTNLGTVGSPPIARLNGFSLTLVPEPSTALLSLFLLLALLMRRPR